MRRHSEIKERQNDEEALTLLRASEHCMNRERYVKYLMIFMSFSICLAAIFNRYLPQMLPAVENVEALQSKIATYINMISGVVLVSGIALGFYVSRMHTEGTSLRDKYEAYVFNNAPNLTILRPIPQTMIEIYAKKTRRKRDEKFRNEIYGANDSPSDATAQFEYIKKDVRFNHKLYIYIQPFFLTIWIGFCILIMIIAVSFNDSFITTLINIMIPSISAISIIASSWHSCRLQIRQLQNLLSAIDEIQAMPENRRMSYITDKHNMRLLADGLFVCRVSPFVIPKFLVRKFQKSVKSDYNGIGRRTMVLDEAAVAQAKSDTANTPGSVSQKTAENARPVQTAKSDTPKPAKTTPAEKTDKAPAVKPKNEAGKTKTEGQKKPSAAENKKETKPKTKNDKK